MVMASGFGDSFLRSGHDYDRTGSPCCDVIRAIHPSWQSNDGGGLDIEPRERARRLAEERLGLGILHAAAKLHAALSAHGKTRSL